MIFVIQFKTINFKFIFFRLSLERDQRVVRRHMDRARAFEADQSDRQPNKRRAFLLFLGSAAKEIKLENPGNIFQTN